MQLSAYLKDIIISLSIYQGYYCKTDGIYYLLGWMKSTIN